MRRFRHLLLAFPTVTIAISLGLIGLLTLAGTQFQSVTEVLSVTAWGAGTPSSSAITAFATGRPWWKRHLPEAIQPSPAGGIVPLVRVPRTKIQTIDEPVLPERSIGYDAFLGAVTALRSLFSTDLVFDFALMIRLQHWLLVLGICLLPVVFHRIHPAYRTPLTFSTFFIGYLFVLLLRPNKSKFLTDGLIDSALANALALLSVAAFWLVLSKSRLENWKQRAVVTGAGLFLSFVTQVRGEFLIVGGLTFSLLALVVWKQPAFSWKGLVLAGLCFLMLPVGYGAFNQQQFGHFVPLRMRSGQNLFEPVGQFPNPWGIQYSDPWLEKYLNQRGIEYTSFEADRFLTAQYVQCLKENPWLFVRNFHLRLWQFAKQFGLWLNFWTIPLILVGFWVAVQKQDRLAFLAVPLILAIGYLIFFGWTNSLLRLVSPVHFLVSAFLTLLSVEILLFEHWRLFQRIDWKALLG